MVDDKKAKAKKMITIAEAKTDNRSASDKGADRIEEMVKNLTSDQTKSLILALKTRREDLTGKSEGSVGRRLREMAKGGEVKKYMGGGSVQKKKNKMLTTKGWGASRKT